MAKPPKLKVDLGTAEQRETCLATLQLCVQITRNLIGDAAGWDGQIALEALARTFEEVVIQRLLDSHVKGSTTPTR